MSPLLSIHAGVTLALVGLIWTIQVVHYPLFAQVGREAFPAYHRRHSQRITWVVAPLMFAELLTAGLLLFTGYRDACFLVSLPLLVFNWVSTGLIQIPLHTKLGAGFTPEIHSRLVATNWWRTSAWTLRGVLMLPGSVAT